MAGILSKSISCSCHEIGHTWEKSCSLSTIQLFYDCFKYALKVYAPLYVVSAVLSGKGKEYFKKKIFRDILQSSVFLGSSGGFMIFCFCVFRKLLGSFNILSIGFLPGIISSYGAILIERKSRRGALAIYMLNQAVETCYNMLKSSGYVRDLPLGEVFLFAGSLSVTMYLYRSNNLPDGFVKDILQKLLGERKTDCSIISSSPKANVAYIKKSCELAGKAFLAGYGLQASFNLLMAITQLFKNPSRLIKIMLSKVNFQAGAFLGSLVALYKFTEKALSQLQSISTPAKSAIAGGIAGFAMLFQRSSYIALYLTSKTIESFYMNGINKGIFPYIEHFDSILYALATGLMFHAALIQPLYLRLTYFKFLVRLTNNKFAGINRFKMEPFGLDSSKIDRMVADGTFKFS